MNTTSFTTLIIILFSSFAIAQDANSEQKVETLKKELVMVDSAEENISYQPTLFSIARIHKFKNDRVKKALVFNTIRNKAKLA